MDIEDQNLDIEDKNLDIEDQNLDIEDQNLDIEDQNLDIEDKNLDIGDYEEIKLNEIDVPGIINHCACSNSIKKVLLEIYDCFFNKIFGRSDIVKKLNVSYASGTNYINYLLELKVIQQVKGKGKGKYKFR